VLSASVSFEVADPNEPAPQLPSTPAAAAIKLNVSETLERPTTPPLGVPQAAGSDKKQLKQSTGAKKPAAASSPSTGPKSVRDGTPTKSKGAQQESSGPSKIVVGAVALAAVAIVGIGGWLGWRQLSNNKKK